VPQESQTLRKTRAGHNLCSVCKLHPKLFSLRKIFSKFRWIFFAETYADLHAVPKMPVIFVRL